MPTLKNVINQASRGADLYFVFRFLRLLTMKYTSTEAYKLGIIDKKGKALKKSSELETVKEKASYTMLHRLVFKIRGLIEKIPVIGKSILLNYAAALFLLKEQKDTRIWTDDVYMKTKLLEFLETDWEADAKLLKEEVDNMGHKSFKSFLTEAPLFRGKEPLYDKDDGTQEKWMKEIEKGINAPYVSVGKSAIGGDSIMIRLSLDKESTWSNKIYQNSRYSQFHLERDGSLEQFAKKFSLAKFRKSKVKTPKATVDKINAYLKKVDEEVELDEKKSDYEDQIKAFLAKGGKVTRGKPNKQKIDKVTKDFMKKLGVMKKKEADLDAKDKEELEKMMEEELVVERKMTDAEKDEREEIVMKLKKKMPEFKKRYGDDAKSVMYATATKQAMEEMGNVAPTAPDSGGIQYQAPVLGLKKKKKKELLKGHKINESVQRTTFAGKDVFIVDSDTFHNCRLGKKKYGRYEKYVGNGEVGQTIREYGLKYPRRPIILQNGESGPMLYLKYGRS